MKVRLICLISTVTALVVTGLSCETLKTIGAVTAVGVTAPLWIPVVAQETQKPRVYHDPRHGMGQLDIFPDNSAVLIAYAQESETPLLSIDVASGDSHQLTPPGMVCMQSSISPDGTRVAFISLGKTSASSLWVVRSDGTQLRQLTDGPEDAAEPAWSPDSQRIVFMAIANEREADLWTIRPDGDGLQRRTHSARTHDMHPQFAPHGNAIIFARAQKQRAMTIAHTDRWRDIDLFSIADDSDTPQRVCTLGWFEMDRFAIAHSENRLLWPSGRQLLLDQSCTLGKFSVPGDRFESFQEDLTSGVLLSVAYATGSDAVLFSISEPVAPSTFESSLYVIDATTAFTHELPGRWPHVHELAISPDGEWAAFIAAERVNASNCEHTSVVHKLYAQNTAYGEAQQLAMRTVMRFQRERNNRICLAHSPICASLCPHGIRDGPSCGRSL
ncbi:MAG: PD40 domain-containing protein [Candidatus Hydrogenedentes bacterium]|nr:PD40 domain-containing protein [Candidatus Hydrogenedentota bacterium]